MLPYRPMLKPLARQLRRDMTDAEQRLWAQLRRKQVAGQVFNRQKPLGGYIADFYCAAARLVIEIDGSQHGEADAQAYDQLRTQVLEGMGLRVLRFDNRQVLMETKGVMAVIFDAVWARIERVPGGEAEEIFPSTVEVQEFHAPTGEAEEIPPNPPFSKGGVE